MYVRSLARDLAAQLDTCGYVSSLRRTKVGPFRVENAVSLEKMEQLNGENAVSSVLLPIKAALEPIPTLKLSAAEAQTLRLGQKIIIRPAHGELYRESLIFCRA